MIINREIKLKEKPIKAPPPKKKPPNSKNHLIQAEPPLPNYLFQQSLPKPKVFKNPEELKICSI
jgi:hypothetical protein